MKNILLYILIGLTTTVFSQKKDTSNDLSKEERDRRVITTESKNLIREGNKFYNKGLYVDAEKSYQKARELNPEYDKANYNFGNTQFLQNKTKEAKEQYQLVSKTTKDKFIKADSEHNLGNIAMKEKQYAPAINHYKNALRKNPNDNETRYNLALAQKLLKDEQNKDKNKDDKDKNKDNKDKNKDKNKDDKKDEKDKDKNKDDKKDKGDKDKDKKGDEDKKDDEKDGKGKNDKDKEKQQPKPQPSKLSPDQVKQLLEAMNNEENKTQKKMNARKERVRKVKQDKDW